MSELRGHWSNRLAFIMAATGSAVGLGNVWKFPYITGEYGGGAFVLVYLVCIALIGLPLLIGEVLIGRRGDTSPGDSFARLAGEAGHSRHWAAAGSFGVLASFLILTFYSVIGGWALAYLIHALSNGFAGNGVDGIQDIFTSLLASPGTMIIWHSIFITLAVLVVARGINRGIEKAITVLMPSMFVLLIILVCYAFSTRGFSHSLDFLFTPDFSKLSTEGVLTALGHAFFTLSLGMSVMIAYGSYLPRHISITGASITVSVLDTLVALLAGIAIFSIVFTNALEPGAGPGLVFQTLPLAFGKMSGGYIVGVCFFFMLVFAAWSSAISLLEPVVERLETVHGIARPKGTLLAGTTAWLIGLLSVLSFNVLADFKPALLLNKTVFDFLDYLTANIMLPVTGLLVALFCGWVMREPALREELNLPDHWLRLWRWTIRYLSPVLILIVFAYNLWIK